MIEVKYPKVRVKLLGTNGNAFAILGRVRRAMKNAGLDDVEIQNFMDEAMSGDYNNLLATCMRWVEVD